MTFSVLLCDVIWKAAATAGRNVTHPDVTGHKRGGFLVEAWINIP
jgi:hypothetical protein